MDASAACSKWRVAVEQIVLSKGQKRRDSPRMARVTHGRDHAMRDFAQKLNLRFLLPVSESGVYARGPPSRPYSKVPEGRGGGRF
jgi:hypothetical protein